jgi:Resolvase, N terminal domain
MRKIIAKTSHDPMWQPPALRIDRKAAIYARRSPTYARDASKDKTQSREMQTQDLLEWGIGQGWLETDLEPYFADFGLSGTLRPDERPDMLRLFDDLDSGKLDHGTVICFQESRLFRDESQIYYNQFIQKCKEHDVLVVAVSPYMMIYDFSDEFLTEMFRWKCKEAGEFIRRQIKGWMHPARIRAAKQGYYAGMGDVSIGYIVDKNPKSPTYNCFVVYEPHAEVVRYLFRRFMELCGDLSKFFRELVDEPVEFPAYPQEILNNYITKNRIMNYSLGKLRTRSALLSILTNRCYLGWRVVQGEVVSTNNHEAIVNETVFAYAFIKLTGCTLDGEPLDVERENRRFYRDMTVTHEALLKDRLVSTNGTIHVNAEGHYDAEGNTSAYYLFRSHATNRQPGFTNRGNMELGNITILDGIVVSRLFEHIREIHTLKNYDEEIEKKRKEREKRLQSVINSLEQIPVQQKNIAEQIGKTNSASVRDILLASIENLDNERKKLLQAKAELEQENANTLRNLEEELQDLEQYWEKYPVSKRIALINFLIQKVVLDIESSHWLRVEVHWLHEEWGVEQMYYSRVKGVYPNWNEKEEAILREYFPEHPRSEVMKQLPNRSWESIRARAFKLNIERLVHWERQGYQKMTYDDMQFMQEHGIDEAARSTQWERPSMYTSIESRDAWA